MTRLNYPRYESCKTCQGLGFHTDWGAQGDVISLPCTDCVKRYVDSGFAIDISWAEVETQSTAEVSIVDTYSHILAAWGRGPSLYLHITPEKPKGSKEWGYSHLWTYRSRTYTCCWKVDPYPVLKCITEGGYGMRTIAAVAGNTHGEMTFRSMPSPGARIAISSSEGDYAEVTPDGVKQLESIILAVYHGLSVPIKSWEGDQSP